MLRGRDEDGLAQQARRVADTRHEPTTCRYGEIVEIGSDENDARAVKIEAEKQTPEMLWYLSFAKGEFLGGAVVRAHGIFTALARCKELKINPGGEVMAWPIEEEDEWRVPDDLRDRLLSEKEVRERMQGKRVNEK